MWQGARRGGAQGPEVLGQTAPPVEVGRGLMEGLWSWGPHELPGGRTRGKGSSWT